jgi:hypothetical protein
LVSCGIRLKDKEEAATMEIITKYPEKIKGVLSTFDRMIFRGHLTCFYRKQTQNYFLYKKQILKKDFPAYAEKRTEQIKEHAKKLAKDLGRPYIYLESPKESKEKKALKIMDRDQIFEGLICVLSSVEYCRAFTTEKNSQTGKLELVIKDRKCLYIYFYYIDEKFGFMHVRLQTWFPYEIQVYINGREYLGRELDKSGISYKRYDNCFLDISDIEKAQEIANKIQEKKWSLTLDALADKVNPVLAEIKSVISRGGYYWVLWQCEYATDVMFKSREELEPIYNDLVKHATFCFNCEDVMTFLGRKLNYRFLGEVVSDTRRRPQGIRVKHRMKKNFIKMYDKYSVLRVETIINDPYEFKTYKEVKRKGKSQMEWVPMGKSVANIYRYAEVSKASNLRYLNALALAKDSNQVKEEIEAVCNPIEKKGKRYSAFNPISEECTRVFLAVLEGGNNINGFSNKTLRTQLYPQTQKKAKSIGKIYTIDIDKKKSSGRVTRLLGKLRAHGLIAKIPRSFRYKVTKRGTRIMASILKIKKLEIPEMQLAL